MDSPGFKTPVEDRYFEDYVTGSVHAFGMITVEEEGKAISLGSLGIDELRWNLPFRPGHTLTIKAAVLRATKSRSNPDRGNCLVPLGC